MKLQEKRRGSAPAIYYTDGFRAVLEDHVALFRSLGNTVPITVDEALAFQFDGDFLTLASRLKIPENLVWLTMRVSGMHSPVEYKHWMRLLLMPDITTVDQIRQSYEAARLT